MSNEPKRPEERSNKHFAETSNLAPRKHKEHLSFCMKKEFEKFWKIPKKLRATKLSSFFFLFLKYLLNLNAKGKPKQTVSHRI